MGVIENMYIYQLEGSLGIDCFLFFFRRLFFFFPGLAEGESTMSSPSSSPWPAAGSPSKFKTLCFDNGGMDAETLEPGSHKYLPQLYTYVGGLTFVICIKRFWLRNGICCNIRIFLRRMVHNLLFLLPPNRKRVHLRLLPDGTSATFSFVIFLICRYRRMCFGFVSPGSFVH